MINDASSLKNSPFRVYGYFSDMFGRVSTFIFVSYKPPIGRFIDQLLISKNPAALVARRAKNSRGSTRVFEFTFALGIVVT